MPLTACAQLVGNFNAKHNAQSTLIAATPASGPSIRGWDLLLTVAHGQVSLLMLGVTTNLPIHGQMLGITANQLVITMYFNESLGVSAF